jgi:hypothetical protein
MERMWLQKPVSLQTVRGLHAILTELLEMGHGETPIVRADSEIGPMGVNEIDLYDSTKEMEKGVLDAPFVFLIS